MVSFIIGTMVGVVIGVVTMCLVQINRDESELMHYKEEAQRYASAIDRGRDRCPDQKSPKSQYPATKLHQRLSP